MNNYEMVIMVRQDATSTQAQAINDKMVAVIEQAKGKIARSENWGLRNLAYRIDNNRKAHYFCLNFTAPAQLPQEMERQLRINEDVIRVMIIQTENLPTEPSVIMSRKEDKRIQTEEDGE